MKRQDPWTRRHFLKAVTGGTAGNITIVSDDWRSKKQERSLSSVALIGGIATFISNVKPMLKPAFETYAPEQRYVGQFSGSHFT